MVRIAAVIIFIFLIFQDVHAATIEKIVRVKTSNVVYESVLRKNDLFYFVDSKLRWHIKGNILRNGKIENIDTVRQLESVNNKMHCEEMYTIKDALSNDIDLSTLTVKDLDFQDYRNCIYLDSPWSAKIKELMGDKYHLLRYYYEDLTFLLRNRDFKMSSSRNGSEITYRFQIKPGKEFAPMLHMKYNIPRRAKLYAFSFSVKENLLIKDQYRYLGAYETKLDLTREYFYTKERMLKEVKIKSISDCKRSNVETYSDKFINISKASAK